MPGHHHHDHDGAHGSGAHRHAPASFGRAFAIEAVQRFADPAADAAVSAGVVVAGLLIPLTGRRWLDPATSLAIVAVIALGTWGLLRDWLNLATDAVPGRIDPPGVEAAPRGLPGVV